VFPRHALMLLVCMSSLGCDPRVQLDLFAGEPSDDAGVVDAGWEQAVPEAGAAQPAPQRDAAIAEDDASWFAPNDRDAGTEQGDAKTASASSGLVVRYDFSGRGTRVRDLVGSSAARVLGGAELDGTGGLTLDGVDDYVDLPNGTLSSHTSATIAVWLRWGGGVCWQRVFDFGCNDSGEDRQGNALASLFVTLSSCPDGTLAMMAELTPRQFFARAERFVNIEQPLQVTLSFDAARSLVTLYQDGVRVAEMPAEFELAELSDVNAWLGRSQWVQDRFARVRYDEFRMYDRALSSAEVRDIVARGPDAP